MAPKLDAELEEYQWAKNKQRVEFKQTTSDSQIQSHCKLVKGSKIPRLPGVVTAAEEKPAQGISIIVLFDDETLAYVNPELVEPSFVNKEIARLLNSVGENNDLISQLETENSKLRSLYYNIQNKCSHEVRIGLFSSCRLCYKDSEYIRQDEDPAKWLES